MAHLLMRVENLSTGIEACASGESLNSGDPAVHPAAVTGFNAVSTASTPSFSALYTFRYFHTRTISRFDTVDTPCTWKYCGDRYA